MLSRIQIFYLLIFIIILPQFFHFRSVLLRLTYMSKLIDYKGFLKWIGRNYLQLLILDIQWIFFHLNSLILLVPHYIWYILIQYMILVSTYSSLFVLKRINERLTILFFVILLILSIDLNFGWARCNNHLLWLLFILKLFLLSERLTYIQFLFLILLILSLCFTCFQLTVLNIPVVESVIWQWII